MNGAMMKATSRFAIAAAFGLVAGVSSARAADLGGNCCADLEERVAELEATTARKGNRKMSLTITGQVHRMVLWWDDGQSRGTYYGLDNTNSSTRFSFLGEAKVTSRVKVGFEIMYEIEAGGTSSKVSQFDVDGKVGAQIAGNDGVKSFTGNNVDAYAGDARRMAFWVEDSQLGRVTVGRYESAGAITTIDLGGISAGASSSVILVNGSFLIRGAQGQYFGVPWSALGDPAANQARQQLVRWDSPTVAGFILTASIMEDGSNWGTMLRYANEFNGFRVAAGIGYEHWSQLTASNGCFNGLPAPPVAPCAGPADLANPRPDVSGWGASLAVLHVPSGLFAQGHYLAADFNSDQFLSAQQLAAGTFWGDTKEGRIPASQWLIQFGITKNWFGLGNTALFGEYSRNEGWGASGPAANPLGANYAVVGIPGATGVFNVNDTAMNVWGAGITQNLDAAATELYLDWRHFDADITCRGLGVNCSTPATAATLGPNQHLQTESFDAIIGGARVKF
jgi:hypothetical protein